MKHDTILLGPVDRHLQLKPDDRDATVIHPSEMASSSWCPRATWHRLLEHPRKKSIPHRLRTNLIFATGDETHVKWQTWTAEMGILWGKWRCTICGLEILDWSNALEGICIARHGNQPHVWKYREVPLENSTLRIKGHADGIVNPTADEAFVMEVKSVGPGTVRKLDLLEDHESDDMSASAFSKISRPLNDHFRQIQIYLRMSAQYVSIVGPIDRGLVIYEHKADQQIREFVVRQNDRWTDPLFETASDILWAMDHSREVKCPYGGCQSCREYEEA
jgi:hypothetical protein